MRAFLITTTAIVSIIALSACGSNNVAKAKTDALNDTVQVKNKSQIAAAHLSDTVRIANDSLEYEVIIIDAGFNSWLYSRAKPRGYYGEPYLRNKNLFWVTEWNVRANSPLQYGELYQLRIDYDPKINYGYEVNYLLYNYLVYFQITNNQRLGGVVPQY
ncbi:DUF6146 family protein [Flavobacterium psychrotrophum]|uniref:DUF6146 family protein n=1 Tax=Flavobacterium psychrotrophum TaxID=2294119 RepID=UPI000E30DED5|nr:DUF6146 family protein [Flavobacterium psychrotrophum]